MYSIFIDVHSDATNDVVANLRPTRKYIQIT